MYGSIRAPKDTANANSTPKPDEACASLVTGTCALPVTSTVDIVTTTVASSSTCQMTSSTSMVVTSLAIQSSPGSDTITSTAQYEETRNAVLSQRSTVREAPIMASSLLKKIPKNNKSLD